MEIFFTEKESYFNFDSLSHFGLNGPFATEQMNFTFQKQGSIEVEFVKNTLVVSIATRKMRKTLYLHSIDWTESFAEGDIENSWTFLFQGTLVNGSWVKPEVNDLSIYECTEMHSFFHGVLDAFYGHKGN